MNFFFQNWLRCSKDYMSISSVDEVENERIQRLVRLWINVYMVLITSSHRRQQGAHGTWRHHFRLVWVCFVLHRQLRHQTARPHGRIVLESVHVYHPFHHLRQHHESLARSDRQRSSRLCFNRTGRISLVTMQECFLINSNYLREREIDFPWTHPWII